MPSAPSLPALRKVINGVIVNHVRREKRTLETTPETKEPPLKKITPPLCATCAPLAQLPAVLSAQLFTTHKEYRCILGSVDDPDCNALRPRPLSTAPNCLDAYHWGKAATETLYRAPYSTILPEHDARQENVYPRFAYGKANPLTLLFGGLWVGWNPSVPLKGKLDVFTTFHEPLSTQYAPNSQSREVGHWLQPTMEYLVPHSATVHHALLASVPVELSCFKNFTWFYNLTVRASQHLIQVARKLARTEKQSSILTFHFKFTLSPECVQTMLLSLLPQMNSSPTAEVNLERITKLAHTPSVGHFSVQLTEGV